MKDPLKLQRDGFSLAECHHIISLSSINYSLIPSFLPRQLLTFTDSYPLINMQARQQKASEWSGVGTSDAFAIDDSNLFDKLGLQSFVNLSTNFYNRVYDDEEEWFRSIFANSKKQDAIQNQYEFLAQRMGGPPLYSQRRGHPALIARHRTFPVTREAAERWLYHMQQAMASTREIGEESKIKIMNFLRHTAYFLVAGVDELKNQNQEMHPCGHGAGAQHPCKNF